MAYYEYMVKKDSNVKEKCISALIYLAAIVLSIVLFFLLMPYGLGSLVALLIAGIIYGAYRLSGSMKKEFEYIVTEGTIDVDEILNKAKRKRLISFSLNDVSFIARTDDGEFKHLLNQKYDKVIDATSRTEGKKVYFTEVYKNGRTLVKMELTDNMIESLKAISPSKIHA